VVKRMYTVVIRLGCNRKESGHGTHSEVRNKKRWDVDRDVICRDLFCVFVSTFIFGNKFVIIPMLS
jgi:hypothetical protein